MKKQLDYDRGDLEEYWEWWDESGSYEENEPLKFFSNLTIKEKVEWLKDQLETALPRDEVNYALELVDKAFEDVVK